MNWEHIREFAVFVALLGILAAPAGAQSSNKNATVYERENNSASLKKWRQRAEQGNVKSQSSLASWYKDRMDYSEAAKWYKKIADQRTTKANERHITRAQYTLATMYHDGVGVPQDYSEAAKWYNRVADKDFLFAPYVPHDLGVMYLDGLGVPQDYTQALKWFTKSAEMGFDRAQYNLGVMYLDGLGVPQDYTQALKWFTKSAETGNCKAQNNLGAMYGSGEGTQQDYVRAYLWYSLAAAQGLKPAADNRNIIKTNMTRDEFSKAHQLIFEKNRRGGVVKRKGAVVSTQKDGKERRMLSSRQ